MAKVNGPIFLTIELELQEARALHRAEVLEVFRRRVRDTFLLYDASNLTIRETYEILKKFSLDFASPPESAPAAGESGEEKPERPPMLLAATVRPFAPITDWAWYARSGDEWMMILSDVYTCESDVFVGVDRTLSDPAALALYDAEAAPAPEREKEPHGD
jgi:hypothetical protein